MIRKTDTRTNYKEVQKVNNFRYNINFDKVDLEPTESEPELLLSTWSHQGYYYKPTTEKIQADVIRYTIKRYTDEGLTPPAPEDIDVSKYVIE